MKAKDKNFYINRKFVQSTTFFIPFSDVKQAAKGPSGKPFDPYRQTGSGTTAKEFFLFSFDV